MLFRKADMILEKDNIIKVRLKMEVFKDRECLIGMELKLKVIGLIIRLKQQEYV